MLFIGHPGGGPPALGPTGLGCGAGGRLAGCGAGDGTAAAVSVASSSLVIAPPKILMSAMSKASRPVLRSPALDLAMGPLSEPGSFRPSPISLSDSPSADIRIELSYATWASYDIATRTQPLAACAGSCAWMPRNAPALPPRTQKFRTEPPHHSIPQVSSLRPKIVDRGAFVGGLLSWIEKEMLMPCGCSSASKKGMVSCAASGKRVPTPPVGNVSRSSADGPTVLAPELFSKGQAPTTAGAVLLSRRLESVCGMPAAVVGTPSGANSLATES